MNRTILNYGLFIALIGTVIGMALLHSRHVQQLVDAMAGGDRTARVVAAKDLLDSDRFSDAVNGETVDTRIRVVQALEDVGDKAATKQLVGNLKDPDRPVRDRILQALLRIGAKNGDNLQEIFAGLKEGDENIRQGAIITLQTLGNNDPSVTDQILVRVVAFMRKEDDARRPGGDVLGVLPEKFRIGGVSLLLPQLTDKDEKMRRGAAEALGKLGRREAIPALIEAMRDTAQVRRLAIGAIARIADPTGEAALTEAIHDPNEDNEARAQAIAGLGRIATPTSIQTLVRALSDDDLNIQSAAVAALDRVGPPAIAPLQAAMRLGTPIMRVRVVETLSGIASPEAEQDLITALDDAYPAAREAAIKGLGRASDERSISHLISLLGNRDGEIASAASESLAKIGAPARPALARALRSDDTTAYEAAQALGRQGDAAIATTLQAADQSPQARHWAIVALGVMGGAKAADALRQFTKSEDAAVRADASQALGQLSIGEVGALHSRRKLW